MNDMADAMTFPKTMKEFIDWFSFKDRDEVYTNGSMIIPTFRVEQAIEHYEQEIRNKAIDEFGERLKTDYVNFDLYYILQNNNFAFENTSFKSYQDMVDEIAKQMKGGE